MSGIKRREDLNDKINELAMNSENKNIRDLYGGINELKRGYQPKTNLVKDENGDLLADSNTIVNRWKSFSSQLLSVHNVSDVRQIEIHTAEPLVPGPSHVEDEIAKLRKYKSPDSDQIPAEVTQAGGEALVSVIRKFTDSIWNKEEFPDQWMEYIFCTNTQEECKTDINNYRVMSLLSTS
jgi:hypothetical protein